MKIVNLEQGSQEWLAWRMNHITSTDSSVIMGCNPWIDLKTLWQRKLGFLDKEPENAAMRRGSNLEPLAREAFIDSTNIIVTPQVGEHDTIDFIGTSLDGISEDGAVIVEIKCPVKLTNHLAQGEPDAEPPAHYFCQMQHHLMVSGASICYYVSYHPEDPDLIIIKEILPDAKYIEDLIKAETCFWKKNIIDMKNPSWTFDEKQKN